MFCLHTNYKLLTDIELKYYREHINDCLGFSEIKYLILQCCCAQSRQKITDFQH